VVGVGSGDDSREDSNDLISIQKAFCLYAEWSNETFERKVWYISSVSDEVPHMLARGVGNLGKEIYLFYEV